MFMLFRLKKKWEVEIMSHNNGKKMFSSSLICSKHFKEEDILTSPFASQRLRLNAVPSVFPIFQHERYIFLKYCQIIAYATFLF